MKVLIWAVILYLKNKQNSIGHSHEMTLRSMEDGPFSITANSCLLVFLYTR